MPALRGGEGAQAAETDRVNPWKRKEVIGNATLYLGDCLEILPTLPKVDAVITDPPFFMPATHYQSRVGWQRTWGDTSVLRGYWEIISDKIAERLNRTGHFLTFCNHESYPVFYPVMYARFDFLKALIWDKGHVGLGRVWRNQFEMVIAARWSDAKFVEDGKLRSDIIKRSATLSSDREHPVEKPEDLLIDLIEPTVTAGDVVLDPFLGSGTTGSAAVSIGRKFIGIEIEPKYFDIACERITNAQRQERLFK